MIRHYLNMFAKCLKPNLMVFTAFDVRHPSSDSIIINIMIIIITITRSISLQTVRCNHRIISQLPLAKYGEHLIGCWLILIFVFFSVLMQILPSCAHEIKWVAIEPMVFGIFSVPPKILNGRKCKFLRYLCNPAA